MINRSKHQIKVCKALLDKNARVRGCEIGDGNYAVTCDGFTCMVFDVKSVVFDISKIPVLDGLKGVFEPKKEDVQVTPTKELRDARSGYLAKLESGDGKVSTWIKDAYLKEFSGYRFYTFGPLERVLVMDGCSVPVGVVLPVKVKG